VISAAKMEAAAEDALEKTEEPDRARECAVLGVVGCVVFALGLNGDERTEPR
jgi:hypothetical protein